jgi:hypothetical protein
MKRTAGSKIIIALVVLMISGLAVYLISVEVSNYQARKHFREIEAPALAQKLAERYYNPKPYFNTPGDVTIVTDGHDYRLQLEGGFIGSEVFATKTQAEEYVRQMHARLHPAEGKDYRPAP